MTLKHRDIAQRIAFGIASEADFEKIGIDEVRAIKGDTEHPHYRFLEHEVKVVKDGEEDDGRTFEWAMSSEHVDSMGDIIRVAGWNTDRIKVCRCPLFLNHSAEPGPAGVLLKSKKGKLDDGVKALFGTGRFHESDLYGDSEWAKLLEGHRKLVARGELQGCSVGFAPTEYRWPEEEEREALGLPRYGMIFERQELLELSITAIPANKNATRKSLVAAREGVRALVAAGEIHRDAADLILASLEASEESVVRRMGRLERGFVSLSSELPWVRGSAKAQPAQSAPPEDVVDQAAKAIASAAGVIEKAATDAIARIELAAEAAGHKVFARVLRETTDRVESSILDATEQLEDAATRLETKLSTTSERAEVTQPSEPTGSDAGSAVSTGTSREIPTNPGLSAADALLRSIDAANGRTDKSHGSDARPRQAGGVQG